VSWLRRQFEAAESGKAKKGDLQRKLARQGNFRHDHTSLEVGGVNCQKTERNLQPSPVLDDQL
jgi:hypothetical protein